MNTVAMSSMSYHPNPNHSLIFTYGTLKRNFPNYPLMKDLIDTNDAVHLGSSYTTLDPYPLVCGPCNIPFLINLPGQGNRVKGDLFSVSTWGLARVDELEGLATGHYERMRIRVLNTKKSGGEEEDEDDVVDAEAYFAHRSFGEGLWAKREKVGKVEYTEEDARGYVKKPDRPDGWSFVEAVKSFSTTSS